MLSLALECVLEVIQFLCGAPGFAAVRISSGTCPCITEKYQKKKNILKAILRSVF